jgi:hypothetical protein
LAVAAADPERAAWLAAEAETAARSIKDAILKWTVLAGAARAVGTADPERGQAIARSIEDTSWRPIALADVAEAVAAADPRRRRLSPARSRTRSAGRLPWPVLRVCLHSLTRQKPDQ